MTAAPLHIANTHLLLDPAGALFWPERRLLAVADLHLEKGAAAAARGSLVPPYDTRATLDRLAALLRRYRPQTLIALGDSFHAAGAAARMIDADCARLTHLASAQRTIWILGNHDPDERACLPGQILRDYADAPFAFRHIATPGGLTPGGNSVEICGHHHPKARIQAPAGAVTRPCFVTGHDRIMLPAFGAYTGGLDINDAAISALFPRGSRVFLLGENRLFSFAVPRSRR